MLMFFLSLGLPGFVYSQEDNTEFIVFEKVYLHLDRDNYISGEDIWYKAYLVDASRNRLTGNSRTLYVEFLSPELNIIDRQRIRLEGGTGAGDFQLAGSLESGTYLVRAYTNWMRNFGEDFFFHREISILNPEDPVEASGRPGKQGSENVPVSRDDTKEPATGEEIDLQFFPEGGSLVAGVPTRIGFKAVDSRGRGYSSEGHVITADGRVHAKLESTHLGMGSFTLTPEYGAQYMAILFPENASADTHDLPELFHEGLVLNINPFEKENLIVVIKASRNKISGNDSLPVYLQVKTGEGSFLVKLSLSHTAQSIKLLKKDIPPGISRIVLYDENFKPHCERLVYVDPPPVRISVEPDRTIYTPNAMTRLRVKITNESGAVIPAELSVSAVDIDAISRDYQNGSHIRSYYYLESELKGNIENPGYYFNSSDEDRFKNLDLLLMTQGWRDFLWKYVADTTYATDYPAEKGLTISGRFENFSGTKPVMDASISLTLMGRDRNYYGTNLTDRRGNYSFRDLDIQGKERVLLSGMDQRGRKRGRIFLDSIMYPEVSVNYRWSPPALKEEDKDFIDDARAKSNLMKKYRLSDTILIEEVKVTARWRPRDDGHQRIFSKADNVVEVNEHERLYRDIFELIQGRVPGVLVTGFAPDYQVIIRGVSNLRGDVEPLYLLDGLPVSREFLVDLPVRTVDKVEVLKDISNLAMYGSRGANGVIIVYSKQNIDPLEAAPVQHAINTEIRGYYEPRIFYAPRYDLPRPENRVPDLRNTIYWEPNVKIRGNGEGELEYYNADVPTRILVTLEGITNEGIPLYHTISYEVD